jgi:uncharacterized RDD family membrane protein YckC
MNTVNPYAPPRASVQDVTNSAATLAERGSRLGAHILDVIILLAMVYVPLLIGLAVHQAMGGLLAVAGFIAWCWLTILFILRNGQSIGKKIVGIKVIKA